MKHLLLALALFSAAAAAQIPAGMINVCNVQPPSKVIVYTDVTAPKGPASGAQPAVTRDPLTYPCAPVPTATSTAPTVRTNAAGATVWWYCKAGRDWAPSWAAATWAFMGASMTTENAKLITQSADPLAALNTLSKARAHTPLSDPALTPVWCPVQAEMFAGTPKSDPIPPPPLPAFVVAKNGSSATRPTYTLKDGKVGPAATLKIPVGSACDMTVTIKVGTVTYGQVQPGLLAVCVPRT